MMTKRYTPTFKAQLVTWRTMAIEGLPSVFTKQDSTAALTTDYAERLSALYAEIERRPGLFPLLCQQ
jgi:hypothetical protein